MGHVTIAVVLANLFNFVWSLQHNGMKCVPLNECLKLKNLLREKPLPLSTVKLVRASICNYDEKLPKVWCRHSDISTCKTSDGEQGRCIPFNKCTTFEHILNNPDMAAYTRYYFEPTLCDYHNPEGITSICCPNPKTFERPPVRKPNTEHHCGVQSFLLLNRIVGGEVTGIDEFPWTVLLHYEYRAHVSAACGGTLINNRYVTTAAHCVDRGAIRSVGELTYIVLGEFDTRNSTDCINNGRQRLCTDPIVRMPVEEIIIHPQWYTKPRAQINHDIALIRFETPVKFTNYIKPICLPQPNLIIEENQELVVAGWGKTEYDSSSSVKLKTTILMANKAKCVQKYRQDKKLVVGEGEICVGGAKGRDSCVGDSGGPLMLSMQEHGRETWYLIGVVSFGPTQPCGVEGYPGLYTYLPKYVQWIHDTIKN